MKPPAYPLLRLPCRCSLTFSLLLPSPPPPTITSLSVSLSASSSASDDELTAKERRQQRRERRESRAHNWREEVEDRLIHEPARRRKKPPAKTWREDLNLDLLAHLGPQWWLLRVSAASGSDAVERLARSLVRNYPHLQFKIYFPSVKEKRKLKNGSYSIKSKPLYPGCVFLHCILDKELHDFIRECDGCYGFIGSTVGSIKRTINKPKPIPAEDVEAIFKKEKEDQEKTDKEFEEKEKEENVNSLANSVENSELVLINKIKSRSRKSTSKGGPSHGAFTPGVSVRVLSGPFSGFTGSLLEINRKNKKATVQLMLFGKESFADLDIDQIETVDT